MSSDFRTANLEKKILNRITYLEQLQTTYDDSAAERNKIAEAIEEQRTLLAEVQEQVAQPDRVKECPDMQLSTALPDLPEPPCPSYPLYVPPSTSLDRWKAEARIAQEAYGDRTDHPRRVVVLVEAVEDLLRILKEENINVDPIDKPDPTRDLTATESQEAFPLLNTD